MKKYIDLHIHTNNSDGELSPKEIIDEAVKNEVSIISITDHDTIDAYTLETYDYACEKDIKIINGVEISTKFGNATIHVLGYDFDIDNEELKQKLIFIRNSRHNYLYNVSKKLNELGYVLNFDKLDKIDSVTKSHIAHDIVTNVENNVKLLEEFGHIPNRGEFIETIMNFGCPGYVKKETITPKEAAELIRNAGGKVVLAHPVVYKHIQKLTDDIILEIINDMKADGIEANYIYVDSSDNKINEIVKWNEFAKKHNLVVTTGSDFHKRDSKRPKIGLINELIEEGE